MARNFLEEAASLDFSDEFSLEFHKNCHGQKHYGKGINKYNFLPPEIYKKLKLTSNEDFDLIYCYIIAEIDFGTAQGLRLIMTI